MEGTEPSAPDPACGEAWEDGGRSSREVLLVIVVGEEGAEEKVIIRWE